MAAKTHPKTISFAVYNGLKRTALGLLVLLTALDLWGITLLVGLTARNVAGFETTIGSFCLDLVTLCLGIVWIVVWRVGKRAWSKSCRNLLCFCWLGVLAALFAIPFTYWPMRVMFALQRPQFEQLAQRIERGEIPTKPVHVGINTITLAEHNSNGIVCLWIGAGGNPQYVGFVKCKSADVSLNFPDMFTRVELADGWRFIEEY